MGEYIRTMIPAEDIDCRIRELAALISRDYAGRTLHMICVLKGGAYFMMMLSRYLDESLAVTMDFMSVSSYGLYHLLGMLWQRKPNSLRVCTLLDKPDRRGWDVRIDYAGFEIEDVFVVGCGLDYKQKYRNLPYIGELVLE